MTDFATELHDAVWQHLQDDIPLAMTVSDRIYGVEWPEDVTWPYVRLGVMIGTKVKGECWTGEDISLTVHGFASGHGSSKTAREIGALTAAALDETEAALTALMTSGIYVQAIDYVGGETIPDRDERQAWHSVQNFQAQVREDVSGGSP